MLIIPAIDLRGGQCVRLRQGKFDEETVFDRDPVAVARKWEREGAQFLHVVDLDGAREGVPGNMEVVAGIRRAVDIPMQLGGGIRTTEDAAAILAAGVERAVVGTRAVREIGWLRELSEQFPGQIALAIDAREGQLVLEGWGSDSGASVGEFVKQAQEFALAAIIYTDVERDGMLAGPNVGAIEQVARGSRIPVIASGGVTEVKDIALLARLPLAGIIIGRALYEQKLTLKQAMEAAQMAGLSDRR